MSQSLDSSSNKPENDFVSNMASAGGANAKILADIQRARDVLDGRVPLDLPAHALSAETNEIAPQDMDAYLKLRATQYHYEQILNTLKSSQQQHSDDQAAIVSYLRTELQQEEQRLEQARTHNAEMTTKCNQLQRGVDEDWDKSKQRYSDELTKLEQQQRELNIKFNKLSSLSEQKAALEESLQQHRELLEQTRAEHAAAISEFERQSVAERERLKKDMINKIRENSKRFERMTEDQLHTTTLTTIQMHQSFVDELEDQSQKTEKLLAKNKQLMAEHKVRQKFDSFSLPLISYLAYTSHYLCGRH
jgi:DNA repair exonuclease SbcCD ATPase subunit